MQDHKFYINFISRSLNLNTKSVDNTIQLLNDGSTIPFISRYRKEVTGNLDEVQIFEINKQYEKLKELEKRKESILASIEEQGKLTDELKQKIDNCYDGNELEDLYLPYKKKRKTKADIAKENGLEPLALAIFQQQDHSIASKLNDFINEKVASEADALQGAKDIIAEWVSEDQLIREHLRNEFRDKAVIGSKVVKTKKDEAEAQAYKDYFEFSESLHKSPSHRFLAMMRGENEGYLRVIVDIEEEDAISYIKDKYITCKGQLAEWNKEAIEDAYKRLIVPSVENQIRNEYKLKADEEAIKVFAENLKQLLMAAPLGQKSVLALDPGFRTGCKVVCLDEKGDFLENKTIYPHEPQKQAEEAKHIIRALIDKHRISTIAIGNGTASRETKSFIDSFVSKSIQVFVVSENGASIYSASDVAREEFPDQDVTVRGAISIGRRLLDPLAELVKIDAKSVGVGQYQHDVDQSLLKASLDQTVINCVNRVGVNLNTASKHLLNYVSGLGATLSQNIVKYRSENGQFTSRAELLNVTRLGAKAYEQCAGFLRIKDGKHPLDNTGVHPESYHIVEQMARDLTVNISELIANKELRRKIELKKYTNDTVGLPTLNDIMNELDKPGLDIRGEVKAFAFDERVKTIKDVYEGMQLNGIVTNLTNFGAFVDIGIKEGALIHISKITKRFIKNPAEVLKLGQEVQAKVIAVDAERGRVNLSLVD